MIGKICIITGANRGLGKAASLELARRGARVIMACRNLEKAEEAKKEILSQTGNNEVEVMEVDLGNKTSINTMVDRFKKQYDRLDVLVNNAAVYKSRHSLTPEGLETMFAINHMGPFRLTNLLIDKLKASEAGRIINITAPSTTRLDFDDLQGIHRFRSLRAFGASKMCNLLFTYELADRLKDSRVTVNALFPGLMRSDLMKEAPLPIRILTKAASSSPQKAAESLVHLIYSRNLQGVSGKFFKHTREIKSSPYSYQEETRKRLWDKSIELDR